MKGRSPLWENVLIQQEARPDFKTRRKPQHSPHRPLKQRKDANLHLGPSVFTPTRNNELVSDGLRDERGAGIAGLEMAERIQEASRLVSIGELTSGVAQEINDPLSIVAGFAEMMMDCALPHPFDEYVQKIYVESRRAANIVQNLLEFSRKCEPRREFKSIQFVIKRALELKQHDFRLKNIEIVTDWPRNLPRTIIDERQLIQAVVNVLTNAEHAITDCRGLDQLLGSNAGSITLIARAIAGNVNIMIADDGPGIPKNNLERIFDPFFTTKGSQEGTGLGLSDCRRIVEFHDGRIWAESNQGKGSTICMRIPVLRP